MVGSINSFQTILRFVSRRLLRGGREQCGHCDRLINSKMSKEIQKRRKVYSNPLLCFSIKTVNF